MGDCAQVASITGGTWNGLSVRWAAGSEWQTCAPSLIPVTGPSPSLSHPLLESAVLIPSQGLTQDKFANIPTLKTQSVLHLVVSSSPIGVL